MKNILWFILLIGSSIFAQSNIEGNITDSVGNPINNASIIIKKTNTEDIIKYSIADSKGKFNISFSSSYPKVDIQIRCMGFETIVQTIDNKSQIKNFSLKQKAFILKEVIVKAPPISQKGDTLKYFVNSFAKEQDRSIGDVLKRLPGFEVLSDGKILYQGKAINKYYIEGLDLLEGKYNLANDNLPYKEVTQVQVLENHQPIKALDSLKFSDNAAINIKLKNSYTFTGQARLGVGLSPFLWDVNVTPMLFTKKKQMLSTYQSNNTGDNITTQLKKQTIEDLLNQFENNSEKTDWLAIQQLQIPNFSEKRWLNNNIHLLSGNYLQKLNKDYELRVNFSYLNDYQQQNGYTNTQFFTPINTINIVEINQNHFFNNSLQSNITLQKNTKKNYFKKSIEFQGFWDSQRGNILLNTKALNQQLKNEFFRVSNNLKSIFPIGKKMITLNSYIGYNKTPQTLNVNPGQFENLLNFNLPYTETFQKIKLQTYYTNNSISYIKKIKHISIEPKIGFQLEKQKLLSGLTTFENTILSKDFFNELSWFRTQIYTDFQTQYKKNKWRLEINTPLNFHHYQLTDNSLSKTERLNRITFEPRLSVIYDLNSFWKLNTSANISNQFGTINQLHYGYILKNYRNIQRINSPLPQSVNKKYTFGFAYRNPIKMYFWNIMYTNMATSNNLLYKTQVLPNGATVLQALEQKNKRNNHNLATRGSKYFSKVKSTITLNATIGIQKFQQIINTNLTTIKNENLTIGSKVLTDITSQINIEYQANYSYSKNKVQNQNNPTIKQQNHLVTINFFPKKNHFLSLKSEFINSNLFTRRTKNNFTDFLYRYTLKKTKTDFEFQVNNLFNTTNFSNVSINDFSYVETVFNLRPRQVLCKIRFTL